MVINIPEYWAKDTILKSNFFIHNFSIFAFAERGLPAKALYGGSSSVGDTCRLLSFSFYEAMRKEESLLCIAGCSLL